MKQKMLSTSILFIFTLMCVGAYMLVHESKASMVSSIQYAGGNKKESTSKETENKTTEKKDTSTKNEKKEETKKPSGNKEVNNDVLTPDPSIAGKVEKIPSTPVASAMEVIQDTTSNSNDNESDGKPEVPEDITPEEPKEDEDVPSEPEPIVPEPTIREIVIDESNYQNIINLSSYQNITVRGDFNEDIINISSTNAVDNLNIETSSMVNVNSEVNNLNIKSDNASIYINVNQNINNVVVKANDANISGLGTISNLKVEGERTKAFIRPDNVEKNKDDLDVMIYQNEDTRVNDTIIFINNSSLSFTLNKDSKVNITLEDVKLYAQSKNVTIYNIYYDEDSNTYTLVTSPLEERTYNLYVTLPNGNQINKSFTYENTIPTVTGVNVQRTSSSEAIIELYSLNTDGYIYYKADSEYLWPCNNEDICMSTANKEEVKKGYNKIVLNDLEENTEYHVQFILENNSGIQKFQSYVISTTVSDDSYSIIKASESAISMFSIELDKAPEKDLTINDFTILVNNNSLSMDGAKLLISDDRLKYLIKVKDSYDHKANSYSVSIKINNKNINAEFASDYAYPVITGQKVSKPSDTQISFTFNSDESGTLYYGILKDLNVKPLASDVLMAIEHGNTALDTIDIFQTELKKDENKLEISIPSYEDVSDDIAVWALFVDSFGNYKTGFVDYYEVGYEAEESITTLVNSVLAITAVEVDNKVITLTFNDEIVNFTTNDIAFAMVSNEETRVLNNYHLTTDKSKRQIKIHIPNNYYFPKGNYEIIVSIYDKDNRKVKIAKEFTIG